MKWTRVLTTLLLPILELSPYTRAANVVRMTISKRNSAFVDVGVLPRATVSETLISNLTGGAAYLAEVKIGSPGQTVSLVIDTGSSDTFVLANNDDQCNNPRIQYNYGPCLGGTFESTASSTFKTVTKGGFKVEFVDQLGASGDYISDNFEIGGSSVKALQMGLALHSTVGFGILGIGYQAGESVAAKNRYPNLIDQLVSQKLINLRAYSLYLDDKDASTGSILFGGIDTEKFIGTLKVVPVQKDPQTQTFDSFYVSMISLSMTDQAGHTAAYTNAKFPLSVVLDSGTSLTYLPVFLVDAVISELGAVDDTDNSGYIFADCDWRTTRANAFLTFGFGGSGGPVIQVALSEMIRTLRNRYPGSPFENTCDLGIRASDTIYLLGDTFLRSAYVVYDIDHNQIALAQANFETKSTNIHEIPSAATGIPTLSGKTTSTTQVPQSHSSTSKTLSNGTPTPVGTVSSLTTKGVAPSTTSGSTSPSISAPTSLSTSVLTSVSTSMSTSASGTGSGTTAAPTSAGSSTASATSKSSAARKVPTLWRGGMAVFFPPIMIGLVAGSGFLVL